MNIPCQICNESFDSNETETLICNHTFCLLCLLKLWSEQITSIIKCPFSSCCKQVSIEIIRQILDEKDIEIYEQTVVKQMKNVHQCILPECSHYNKYSNIEYQCQFCSLYNCISCNAAHHPTSCRDYKLLDVYQRKSTSDNLMQTARQIYAEKNRKSIIKLSSNELIPNTNIFQCGICSIIIRKKAGISLSKCFHNFCKNCFGLHVSVTRKISICCPACPCIVNLKDTEYREFLEKCNNKNKTGVKHCKFNNCENVKLIVDGHQEYWDCQKCKSRNCLNCDTIHTNLTCDQYLGSLDTSSSIEERIKRKEMMRCPNCEILIVKISGCDHIQCLHCNTQLSWILQTYRREPKDIGYTSGGFRFFVDNILNDAPRILENWHQTIESASKPPNDPSCLLM